jgi:hypothetical protein
MKQYSDAVKVLTNYRDLCPDEECQQTNDLIMKLSGML